MKEVNLTNKFSFVLLVNYKYAHCLLLLYSDSFIHLESGIILLVSQRKKKQKQNDNIFLIYYYLLINR